MKASKEGAWLAWGSQRRRWQDEVNAGKEHSCVGHDALIQKKDGTARCGGGGGGGGCGFGGGGDCGVRSKS